MAAQEAVGLPPALLARLAKRGIIKGAESEESTKDEDTHSNIENEGSASVAAGDGGRAVPKKTEEPTPGAP